MHAFKTKNSRGDAEARRHRGAEDTEKNKKQTHPFLLILKPEVGGDNFILMPMQPGFKYTRREFAGSLGDMGALLPMALGLIALNGLSFSTVFLLAGFFYIATGIYFRLPVPIQPLKVVAAVAIASPTVVTPGMLSASALLMGLILLALTFTGLLQKLIALFHKPIVRGIQLGLGLLLIKKGISFISNRDIFINLSNNSSSFDGTWVNPLLGILGFMVVLIFLNHKKLPASLILVGGGILAGILFNAFQLPIIKAGPTDIALIYPDWGDFIPALILLVLPQLPLTLGNAIFSTHDVYLSLFKENAEHSRVTVRSLALSISAMNLISGAFTGMPVCHGAGGLVAHYRFGARTGGSNIIIGVVLMVMALGFGHTGKGLLMLIPNAVLGVLLFFTGLELCLLVRDIKTRGDSFIVFLIAGISLATGNMAIAFVSGMLAYFVIKYKGIEV